MTAEEEPLERMPVGRTEGSGGVGNAVLVARREYIERVRSRAFVFSTLLLAGLAIVVALIPLGVRLVDRATVTRVVVVAPDAALAQRAISTMDSFLNTNSATADGGAPTFTFERLDDADAARALVREGAVAGAMLIERGTDGGLRFTVLSIGGLSPDRAQLLQVGSFAVGILDWTASQPPSSTPFVIPGFKVSDPNVATGGSSAGGDAGTIDAAEYASRRIVGIVFVVLSFLTLVFYGLWVASGVAAEKAGRVMELLISAATAQQLVIGKIVGIGLAGLTQVTLVLLPAIAALLASGAIADQVLGPDANAGTSLAGLSPGLLGAFLVYFVLGFALYAALYAGAGSLLSRAEDLQTVALPLSIPAIMGYFPAVLALSGGTSGFIRFASYVPLWSPFVMLARLSIGRVEPWEVALSLGLLVITVPLVTLLAIRVYRAGVLLYGQPPTLRTFLRAVRG
ncbi:MAG TPA: ABC transporter permease [Candidatus Limnocylindrales bacterium]|nr:ABC transporter permease [Candidatus Limnocylindrales bacterium]